MLIDFEGHKANLNSVVDITELRETRIQLMESARLAALGEMSTGMAHELNTPLATITLQLENLREAVPQVLVSEFPQCSELIQSQLDRISEIVNQMLHFGREPKQKKLLTIDLRKVIRSVMVLNEGIIKEKGISFRKKLHRSPVWIRDNQWQLEHVLQNLLSNAYYALRGVPSPQIHLSLSAKGGQTILEIQDNGCGIPEEIMPRLKEPFFTSKPPGDGTGLGLSVCHSFIRDHGGKMEISSPGSGQGACFRIKVPGAKIASKPDRKKSSAD